ncbi:MAG TPA: DUF2628 domain-containing protein [Bradyrhizobium sp.]|nr:DUF2628 domain-containing protein [Bradyrhizobium sp.]
MPVYTVHAPVTSNLDFRATDRFTFIRDGFHFWAAVFGVLWLAWHRLWLAAIGWIALLAGITLVMVKLGVNQMAVLLAVKGLVALLLGFEAASFKRWSLSRRKWRQLDIVVADDEEAAERRFFDRWSAKQREGNDQPAVDRGEPPPTRDVPGQGFSRPPASPRDEIIGLFPEPGAPR